MTYAEVPTYTFKLADVSIKWFGGSTFEVWRDEVLEIQEAFIYYGTSEDMIPSVQEAAVHSFLKIHEILKQDVELDVTPPSLYSLK